MPRSRPPLTIHKFGGAALADAAAVRQAVEIIRDQPRPLVVVVSALAGVTDLLLQAASRAGAGDEGAMRDAAATLRARHLAIARELVPAGAARDEVRAVIEEAAAELEQLARGLAILRELTPRTADYVAARGERLSARLVAAALAGSRSRARFIDATEVVRTDGSFGGAAPDLAGTDRSARRVLRPLLSRKVIPIVPGFLGRAPDGHVTTLGRGGSDLTATLLARALGAAEVSLWKDVPGLLTADPRVVHDARVIPQLHPREAAELAYYGAKVLHPRALIPLGRRGFVVRVRPFADPAAEGTEISARRTLRAYPVKALSAMSGQALITVEGSGMLGVPGIAARTFHALQETGVSVSLISQASSEHSICFSVPETSAQVARKALLRAFRDEIVRREIDGVQLLTGMATMAVVGLGMAGTPGIAARVTGALAEGGISIVALAQGSSELNISVVVPSADLPTALRHVHSAFQMSRIGGGAAALPDRMDVVLLGFGQIGRSLARMLPRARHDGATPRVVAVIDRSGMVFDAKGLSPRRLAALGALKSGGRPLSDAPGAMRTSAIDAIAMLDRHALARPVLVDLTADETTPLLRRAIAAGMDIVLANKKPLAGPRGEALALLDAASSHDRTIRHETTVGAGLPIIDTYDKLVESGDRVLRIEGCTSGTLGYLLGEIERGRRFSDALRRAMEKGYTEPDPRDDLSGMDVARKALILARLVGYQGEMQDIAVESLVPEWASRLPAKEFLARIEELDDLWRERADKAKHDGEVLRYVATITRRRVAVGLRAVDRASPFAGLRGTDNQVVFTTTRYRENPLVITGPGAGLAVTAAGVLNDVLRLASA
jgi:aspartokinase/homoserine dehydrogenase 1